MGAFIHVTAWERVSLWRRVLCAFVRVGILIFVLTVLFNLLGPPIGIFFTTRWEGKKLPGVNVAPQALADYSVSGAAGTALSYFGYEFEVPWNTRYTQKVAPKGGLVLLKFESGQSLLFIVPANEGGLLSEMVQDQSSSLRNLQPVFGDLTNRPAYDQYAVLLNTTPRSIRSFGPRAEAVRGVILLTTKAIAFPRGLETGVFSFELPDKRGFQIGDPRKSRSLTLEVFGMGGHHVEFLCDSSKEDTKFSQPELNRILTSLHAVAPGSLGASPAHPTTAPK